jgi:hypothetical protein
MRELLTAHGFLYPVALHLVAETYPGMSITKRYIFKRDQIAIGLIPVMSAVFLIDKSFCENMGVLNAHLKCLCATLS